MSNTHAKTVAGFGDEWERFDQSKLQDVERVALFDDYFAVFPWDALPDSAVGFDMGCGSGRWAKSVAPRVGKLICVDPSSALDVARRNLADQSNCEFLQAEVGSCPIAPGSMDFGYSLGVLHHVPNTEAGIKSCVRLLKTGAPLLIYLYYAFDNRPRWFRLLWRVSDFVRQGISRLPHGARYVASQIIAGLIYWPFARSARLIERMGASRHLVEVWPLSVYRNLSFYTMRTDALDRFGTQLEQRFTRTQIEDMMRSAGLVDITFHAGAPYWCAVGRKRD
jgi:ubiquinone/menaquinone biosynthesis C-methylase UbiE